MGSQWRVELSGRGEQTGLLVAAAVAPGTFEPSLVPRGLLDQAVVTGLATTLSYVLTVATQDTIEAFASAFAPRMPGPSAESRQRAAAALLDLAVIPAGLAAQRALSRHPGEAVLRGMARQTAWRMTVTGIGGMVFALVQAGTRRLDDTLGVEGRLARFPIAVPAGVVLGLAVEARVRRGLPAEPWTTSPGAVDPVPAAALSIGVAAALSTVAYGERLVASATGSALSALLPGPGQLWRPVGHALCLGGLAAGGSVVYHRAMHKIEAGQAIIEPALDDDAAHRWVGPTVSGGRDSLVSWDTLGRQGRRHAFAYVRPQPAVDRLEGLPDLSIETVMAEPAAATPIHVYVGLDSAPTARERVELALAEMDRTGAWDRKVLMLVSPTGTGYVNYCATAAAEYLTRGDIATVTLQYSKRPSPLSLFKIKDAREQNRLLWLRISSRLRERTGPRPLVVLFGESLGAHTSQDVLMHWGTLGPQALGIDRALW
ncbi:MAG: alpha/beta-hydrolase family protein, partial [Jiangellaceae bacterium]